MTCNTANTKTLTVPYFSDKTCATTSTDLTGGSIATDTCVKDPTDDKVAEGDTTANVSYIKLYSGCGTTGTLPAGVTAPSTSNGGGAGQVSGASVTLGSLPLLSLVLA